MDNTWHGALGMQYRLGKPWLLSLGFAYDSSPMNENRSPSASAWIAPGAARQAFSTTGART